MAGRLSQFTLQNHVKQMESRLQRLHGLLGGQISAHDRDLTRINGRSSSSKLNNKDNSLFSVDALLNDLVGSVRSEARRQFSNAISSKSSGGQDWSEIATNITRAIQRNM